MKQFLRYTLTLVAILMATANLTAQTYNGGTWYSLYDNEKKDNMVANTTFCEKAVFAPAENITFEYKKLSILSINGQLQVQNKVNGNSWSGSKGEVSISSTSWKTSHEITLDANISHIRYYMKNSTGSSVRNHRVKLKKHILLYDDTDSKGMDYGTSSIGTASTPRYMVNLATAEGKTSTSSYTIRFRSFLASGNITITSSNPEFHFGNGQTSISLGVANNYCASTNGSGNCSATTLGQISNYNKQIYFSPAVQHNKNTRSTTITISDGTNKAYIYLSAPVIPTYFFKAAAYSSPAEGGTATATFENGQNTYSIIAPDYATNSVSTTVTFTATPNSANGYVYDGWKKQLSDVECNPKGAGTESFSKEITSSDLNPNNISSTCTYYAIFTKRYTPIIKNLQNYTNQLVGVPIENLPFQFIDAATEYPSASNTDDFYYTIDNQLDGGSIADCPVEHRGKVIDYYPTEKKIIPRNAGTATITFYHKSTDTHDAIVPVSVTVTVIRHTPTFTWQGKKWNEETNEEFNQPYEDYFVSSSTINNTSATLTSSSSDPEAADWSAGSSTQKLNLTTFYKETTPYSSIDLTVSQAQNYYWNAHSETHTITPKNPNDHVQFTINKNNYNAFIKELPRTDFAWSDSKHFVLGNDNLNPGGYGDKYVTISFTGIPKDITFDYAVTQSGLATYIQWYVQESANGTDWSNIFFVEDNKSAEKVKRDLKPDPKYIKFIYSGNYGGVFKNITVTELNQFEAVPDRLDFGQQYVDEPSIPKTFDFKYANAGYKVQLQSNDSHFTVEPTYIDTIGGEKYGTIKDIKVTYHPTEEHNTANTDAKIYILDEAGHKDSVILTASAIKSTPTLSWTPAWSATEPIVLLNQTVTNAATSSNGYAVKYRSNDESIIQVINDGTAFIGKGTGRVEITAYQEPDRVYNAAEISKTFIVTDKIAQYIVWDDNLTNLRIGDDPITLNAQVWVMTDAASNTWEYSPTQTAELRYSSPNNAVVSIENNILTINGVGELLIEATILADETYEYAHAQVPVRVRDNSTTCSDEDLIIPVKKDGTTLNLQSKLEYDPYLATSEHIVEIDRTAGIPGELIFGYYGREAWWSLSGRIRVYESSDNGSTWQQVLSNADAIKPKAQELQYSPRIPLSTTATHIKFQRFESTNLGYHIIQYITVLPAKYIQAEDIDWGNIYVGNTPDTTITFNYSSVRSDMVLSTSHANLSVTPTTIRKDCGDWGTESLTITLNANTTIIGEFHEQVFIHDQVGNISETIHVYANIVKNSPTITWTPTDTIRSSAEWETKKTAIASSGDQVLYELTAGNLPEEYAYLNNDGKMILLRGGQITARAYTPATTTSNEMSVFHDFIIVVDPLFEDFANDNNWLNDNNWNIGRTPWATDSATIKANKHVQLTTEVSIDGVQFEAGSSIHIASTETSTGGLSVGAQGIQGAASDGSSIIIDNLQTGAGFLRISPEYKGTMPRATVNYQTRSTLDSGANQLATWQYIGAPGANCQFTVDGITWLYQWSEPQNWVNKTGTLTLAPFAGYAITQYGKPTYSLVADLIHSNQTITLTKTPSGMNGNNLFANSYMAPIDAKNFTPEDFSDYNTGREDIVKTFYIFNSGSWNDWNKYDTEQSKGSNGNDTPGQYCAVPAFSSQYMDGAEITTLPPMQGIYVIANTDGAQIHLNYDKHVWKAGTNPDVTTDMHEPMRSPQRMQAQEQMQQDSFRRIRLQLNSANSGADRLYVIQTDETTPLYDNGYDAPNQTVDGLTNIYTTESFGKMEVSCSNHIDSMYIGFQAGSDTQYTLSFSSLIGDMLYLQDLEQDTIVAMQQDMPYTFSATPLTINDHRFRLLLYPEEYSDTPNTPTDTDPADNIRVWLNNNVLHIIGAPANSTLHIYNLSGAHIFTQIISDTPYTYNLSHLSASVYLVRINNYTYKVITK